MFALGNAAGGWLPAGNPYTTANHPAITLLPGWNLVATPYPIRGLDGTALDGELGSNVDGCALHEVAAYVTTGYRTFLHGSTGPFHAAASAGIWIECAFRYTWTPAQV